MKCKHVYTRSSYDHTASIRVASVVLGSQGDKRRPLLMKCTLAAVLAILYLLSVNTHFAFAESIVVSTTIESQLTDWGITISLPKFDPSLGVLTEVEAVVQAGLSGNVQYESLERQPATLLIGMESEITLYDSNDQPFVMANPQTFITRTVTAYDEFFDFGGTSGGRIDNLVAADISDAKRITDSSELEEYIGLDELELALRGNGRSRLEGAGNLSGIFSLNALAVISLTYTFDSPGITLEKLTNGEDADVPTGPTVDVGTEVLWDYIVTNTGTSPLADVVVTDDQGEDIVCPQTTLDINETMTCQAVGVAQTGQYRNVGIATAQPTQPDGSPIGNPISATDVSHYFGRESLGKIGDSVWLDLDYDGIQDPDESPIADVTVQLISEQGDVLQTESTDSDGRYEFTALPSAIYTVRIVSETLPANAVPSFDADGLTSPHMTTITVAAGDQHDHVDFGYGIGSIDIETHTNGEDADLPSGPAIFVGGRVQWEYIVTNRGTITLTEILVSDEQVQDVACPQTVLAPSETITCTAAGSALPGQYATVGTAVGYPLSSATLSNPVPVRDTDPSHYIGSTSACPADPLPAVAFLGETKARWQPSKTFTLPEGFETFIVKRVSPFRFEMEAGIINEAGERIYTTTASKVERVWACAGDCDFTQALEGTIEIGQLEAQAIIHATILDDDADDRLLWWAVDRPDERTETIETAGLTYNASFVTSQSGDWYLTSDDSVGIVKICIEQPYGTGLLSNSAEQTLDRDDVFPALFLPLQIGSSQ